MVFLASALYYCRPHVVIYGSRLGLWRRGPATGAAFTSSKISGGEVRAPLAPSGGRAITRRSSLYVLPRDYRARE